MNLTLQPQVLRNNTGSAIRPFFSCWDQFWDIRVRTCYLRFSLTNLSLTKTRLALPDFLWQTAVSHKSKNLQSPIQFDKLQLVNGTGGSKFLLLWLTKISQRKSERVSDWYWRHWWHQIASVLATLFWPDGTPLVWSEVASMLLVSTYGLLHEAW